MPTIAEPASSNVLAGLQVATWIHREANDVRR